MLTLVWLLIVCLALLYVLVFGLTLPPVVSVYAYLLGWLFIPDAFRFAYLTGGQADLPVGITMAVIFDFVAIAGIFVASRRLPKARGIDRRVRRLARTLLVMALVSFLFGSALLVSLLGIGSPAIWSTTYETVEIQYRILPYLDIFMGLVLFRAAQRLFQNLNQVQIVFGILALVGLQMGLEVMALKYLNLIPALRGWAVDSSGRYFSLIFTNYSVVSLISVVSLGAWGYWWLVGHRLASSVGFVLTFLAVIETHARTPLIALFFAVGFMVWASTSIKRSGFVIVLVSAILAVGLESTVGLSRVAPSLLATQARPDFFSLRSLGDRQSLFLRATDILPYSALSGVGAGMGRYALNSAVPGLQVIGTKEQRKGYRTIVDGLRTTPAHNIYVELVLEHGLMGLFFLGVIIQIVLGNMRRNLRRTKKCRHFRMPQREAAETALHSIMLGVAVHYLLDSAPLPYPVGLLLLSLSMVVTALPLNKRDDGPARESGVGTASRMQVA